MEVFASGFTREMQCALEEEQGSHSQEDTGGLDTVVAEDPSEECIQVESDKCNELEAVNSAGPSDEIQTAAVRD